MGTLVTSKEYLFAPVSGPLGLDLTAFPVDVALMPDDGTQPGSGDWHAGTWLAPQPGAAKQAALKLGPGGGQAYPAGMYMVFVRVTTVDEQPVVRAGRWPVT